MNEINIISLGAGVQSSVMSLMAGAGEIGPMPTCAIFADTMAEPEAVYEWLGWLEKQLPFPVYRVCRGNLSEMALLVRTSKISGNKYTKHNIPAYIINTAGKIGIMNRHCTGDFKIDMIQRKMRELYPSEIKQFIKENTAYNRAVRKAKVLPPQPNPPIKQWIGISLDEVSRIKPARKTWLKSIWPLVDKRMSRSACLAWMKARGFPEPPRSACVYCPFHDDIEWQRMKLNDPKGFQFAAEWEIKYQAAMAQSSELEGVPFLNKRCRPISEIDFSASVDKEGDLFNNECEGVCGV